MKEFTTSARFAGLLYLGIIMLGIGAEAGLRGPLIAWSDPEATRSALAAHEPLFRLSILADLGMAVLDIALAVVFFRMLRAVNPQLSLMAMVFRLMQAAVIAGNVMMLFAALQGDPLPWLERHAAGYDLGLLFFAVNTLIMARLLRGLAPRWICWALGAAGMVYAFGSITRFVAPDVNALMQPAYLVPVIAEVSLMLWLLIWAPRQT
ncbi:DUF4386 domain-containing protein [Thalassobius vesicularis]|uniref:DUF4386 domain-containing protein n=1 Tax=Thalassobius vesicularis TaxID=1294297 RepID=A0A4V3UYW5_9RHOB|nr:DUF4386 domain-containing protein [Thalassobius vesicularis]THD73284.1 DUF4386 domain-containing protein [Thalassobius vesicularis]